MKEIFLLRCGSFVARGASVTFILKLHHSVPYVRHLITTG